MKPTDKCLLFIVCLIAIIGAGNATPTDEINLSYLSSSLNGLHPLATWDMKNERRPIGKKFDRNCFFSPVQCMLSLNSNPADDMIWVRRK
uniref:Neur_chan_LBD domain-containing protein n=1 Tax=Ascaris lumbricoides TaxID=6252 RepID=A0A0M3IJW3_ASCLU